MKRKTAADLILFFVVMLVIAIAFVPTQARATGKTEPAATTATSSSGSSAKSTSAIDLSMVNKPTATGTIRQGDSYSLMSNATAAPLPPGLCPQGDSSYVQILWGLLTVASSTTRSEMECLEKVLGMVPQVPVTQPVENLVAPKPSTEPRSEACPAAAKPVLPKGANGTKKATKQEECKRS